MKKSLSLFLAAVNITLFGVSCQAADSSTARATLSASELNSLRQAPEMSVYLIRPIPNPENPNNFHGYPIVGKVEFVSSESRQAIVECLSEAIDFGYSQQACFVPHHAIRACIEGKNHDFVICFECCEAREYVDGATKPVRSYTVSPYYRTVLNVMIKSKEPMLLSKSRLVGYTATANKKAGEVIAPLDLLRAEKWRDELTGHEVELLDFQRIPKTLKPIVEGQFLKSDEFSYSQ